MPPCRVEEPSRRHGVDPDSVQPNGGHLGKVPLYAFWIAILAVIRSGPEWAIGGTTYVQLLVADSDELPPDAGPGVEFNVPVRG
jgi:hypothetical protein